MIEAGIREKEKDVRNWSPYGSVPWIQPANNLMSNHSMSKDYKSEEVGRQIVHLAESMACLFFNFSIRFSFQEDTYEAGIANDMRELELRWDFELQEQEKRWSSEEDSTNK